MVVIEVAKETVAPVVFPADEIYRVYGRRLPGGIAMADSTVVAVDRKAQWLGCIQIIRRSALRHVYFPLVPALWRVRFDAFETYYPVWSGATRVRPTRQKAATSRHPN